MRLSCHAYCQCDRCIYSPVNLEQTATIILFLVRHPREPKLYNWPLPVNIENQVKVFATLTRHWLIMQSNMGILITIYKI